ncbi:hypothetical protein [Novosphingobium aquae]|uniref:Uncharacterized protein n=1 Tax=Novosphingobium aquae TaxID=3133435 RepID=A0ABU8S5D8_9SPHN
MFASPKPALLASIAISTVAGLAMPLLAQTKPASGPVARYDMRAGTVTGMGAMGGGMRGAMSMAFGGGGNSAPQHELYLRLGSGQPPVKGAPKADHFMPPAAKLGKSVPLLTPQAERDARDELPQMGNEKPKGRMLIFWGCGEHAPKGQPVVIDFAKLAAGQMPPGMWSTTVLRDWGPTLTNSKTFGRWPNEDTMGGNKAIRTDASLLGAHRVAGNYSPEIGFNLTKDFMTALNVRTSTLPSGAGMLRWNSVPEATGFYAYMFGAKQGPGGDMGDMVMWSSSASRQFGGGLQDWLSPSQVAPLVTNKTVLPPSATACIVPAEVKAATDFRMGTLTAFGPEENFSYPPRPADPKAAWAVQWTARVRHRSTTSWMDMPGMTGGMPAGMGSGEGPVPQQPRPNCKPRGLGGIMGGVLTGRTGC